MDSEYSTGKSTVGAKGGYIQEYCFQCKNLLGDANCPINLGCYCSQRMCSLCVQKLLEGVEKDMQCPKCMATIGKNDIKVDKQLQRTLVWLRKRQAEIAERYLKQNEILKNVIKDKKEKEKQYILSIDKIEREVKQLKKQKDKAYQKVQWFKNEIKELKDKMLQQQQDAERLKQEFQSAKKIKQDLDGALTQQRMGRAAEKDQFQKIKRQKEKFAEQLQHLKKSYQQIEHCVNAKMEHAYKALIHFAESEFKSKLSFKYTEKEEVGKCQPVEISRIQENDALQPLECQQQWNTLRQKEKNIAVQTENKKQNEAQFQNFQLNNEVKPKQQKKLEFKEQLIQKIEPAQLKSGTERSGSEKLFVPNAQSELVYPSFSSYQYQHRKGEVISQQQSKLVLQRKQFQVERSKQPIYNQVKIPQRKRNKSPSFQSENRKVEKEQVNNLHCSEIYTPYMQNYDYSQDYDYPEDEEDQGLYNYAGNNINQQVLYYQQEAVPQQKVSRQNESHQMKHILIDEQEQELLKRRRYFYRDSVLRKRVKQDHVTLYLKELDKGHILSEDEFYLITAVEQKKANAMAKLKLIESIRRSNEFPKYRKFLNKVFLFTLDTMKDVLLNSLSLENLIELSPLMNMKLLDLRNNFLKSIKPLQGNISLEVLYLNHNALQNLDGLLSLKNLTELTLYENKLKPKAYEYLSLCNLYRLRRIAIGSTIVGEQNLQCLLVLLKRSWATLQSVYFNFNLFPGFGRIIENYNLQYRKQDGKAINAMNLK